jgi:hypothetical protein
MKAYHIVIISFCLLLSACTPVAYLGDQLPPTTSVDIYYSAHDVTKQYKVIGHLTCQNGGVDFVKAHLSDYAKKIGADAVVITGSTIAGSGKNGTDIVNADALKYDQ